MRRHGSTFALQGAINKIAEHQYIHVEYIQIVDTIVIAVLCHYMFSGCDETVDTALVLCNLADNTPSLGKHHPAQILE